MYQKDPETNSMDNDITAFYLQNECICGQRESLPIFDHAEIGPTPSIVFSSYLLNIPGSNISIERIIPHSPEY